MDCKILIFGQIIKNPRDICALDFVLIIFVFEIGLNF